MEDFPTRLADLLETVANRVRSLTVDRAEKLIRTIMLALPALVLAILTVIFLFATIHAALALPLGDAGAFGVIGGLFLAGAVLLWRKRLSSSEDHHERRST